MFFKRLIIKFCVVCPNLLIFYPYVMALIGDMYLSFYSNPTQHAVTQYICCHFLTRFIKESIAGDKAPRYTLNIDSFS